MRGSVALWDRPAVSSYRYRRWWHGLEWSLGAAAVSFVVGVVMLLIVVLSSSGVQWTGIRVHGQTQAGVVTYTYGHDAYQLPDDAHRSDAAAHPVTVWLSRSHPDDSTARRASTDHTSIRPTSSSA